MSLFLAFIVFFSCGCTVRDARIAGTQPGDYRYASVQESTIVPPPTSREHLYHVVKKGDTLWRIAQRHRISVTELAFENNITENAVLGIGQKLRIPQRSENGNKLLFLWPVKGRIILYFGEKLAGKTNRGIDIETAKNHSVAAAATGRVTFSSQIKGYGNTVIVRHAREIFTVYTNLAKAFVTEGQHIQRGEHIGLVGIDPRRGTSILHFEVRKAHTPVDPFSYLQ